MSRKYKKIIDDEYKQSRDYFRKAIEEQYQKDINKKTGTHSTLDDIAPVKKKEKERTWFDTGLFDDKYQFGDVTKTILGTNKDLSEDLSGGLAGIAEGAVDAGAWAIGGIGKAFGNENLADKMQKFQERDLVKEYELDKRISDSLPGGQAMKLANFILNRGDTEKASVLGEKSDSLAQSAGQLAGTVALQAAGVPWWVTTGVTSFGAGTEQAFKGGATYGEAGAYGAISAGAEVLTEKLSGGIKFGGKALDEGLKKTLTNAITNKTVKTLTKLGFDAVGEGSEEVLTEIIQNIGQKLTYEDEKTWSELLTSEEAMEGYLDAFIGGAVMGGGFNAGRTYKSIKTGRDYDTGLSDNEQRVIDSEVKNRTAEKQKQAAVKEKVSQIIAERERTIGTLTDAEKKSIQQSVLTQLDEGKLDFTKTEIDKKELTAIEQQVREDLDRGDIGIDAIEGTLAAEKTAQINDLRAELSKTTNEAKKAEIQAKLNELTTDRAVQMQELLKKDVYLQESYRQEALKSQEFTREVTDKDSDITKELIESAKAVKMNDTRKMHDLFEYTNKIANDSGTKYGFVNNQTLKELGHDVDGKDVNGLVRVDKDGNAKVLINVDSAKALNTIIGHETTHLLEGTNEYKSLQNIVKQYATTKGDYDVRLQSMKKLYEGVDANLENEITADLVGDYLFTDEQFIKELTADRNVFQKIYDYVKRAYKIATAGSQEKRQLEKVKRSFEKAYKEISKTTTQQTKDNLATDADSNTKLSLNPKFKDEVDAWYSNEAEFNKKGGQFTVGRTSDALKSIGVKDQNVIWDKSKVKKILNDHPDMTIDIIKDVPNIIENPVLVMQSKTRTNSITLFGEVYSEGNPVLVAMQLSPTGKSGKILNMSKIASAYGRKNAQNLIDTSDILYVDGNKKRTDTWLRALGLQLPVSLTTYGSIGRVTYYSDIVKEQSAPANTALADALAKAQKKKDEKRLYSLSEKDAEYKSAVENGDTETAQMLVDEAAKNAGYTIKAYHGTGYDFTVFDPAMQGSNYEDWGRLGKGFYFAPDERQANTWAEMSSGDSYNVMAVYLKDEGLLDAYSALPEDLVETIPSDWDPFTARMAAKYSYNYIEYMQEFGYDVQAIMKEKGYKGVKEARSEYVIFDPENIKSADPVTYDDDGNVIPLSERFKSDNPDIRFSLSAPVEQGKELVAVHNMQSSELMKTLDLGGFPMPSIAIIKAESGHSEFGDVSIVFGKDTIDPKRKTNKLYGGDAWTPTYPRVEYKVNSKVEKELDARLNKILYEIPETFRRGVQRLTNETESLLNSHEGEAGMLKWYANDYDMKQAFLAENGQAVPLKYQRTEKKTNELEAKAFEKYLSETPEAVEDSKVLSGREWTTQYGEQIKEIYTRFLVEEGISETDAKAVVDSQNKFFWPNQARKAFEYRETGGVEVTESPDYKATNEEIDSRIDQAEYESWLKGLLTGIEEKSGIRNNADPFTPSGNRRSWEALHWEHNLENVVKAMKQGQNGEGFFGGNIFGISAKEYRSIAEMKADSSRLKKMDPEEYESIKDSYAARLQEIATSIMDKTASNQFIAADNAMQAIVEAVRTSRTKSGILNVLKEYPQLTVTETTANDIADLVNDISNMPTGYFEAKPRRAVGFDEIEAVIIPDNTDTALVSRLEEGGYNVIQYEAGNEADRAAKLNDLDELKFSLSRDVAPTGSYNVYRSDVLMPEAQTAPVTETPAEAPVEEIAPVVIPEELRYEEGRPLTEEDLPNFEQERSWSFDNITEEDLPAETEEEFYSVPNTAAVDDKSLRMIAKNMKEELDLKPKQIKNLEKIIQDFSTSEDATRDTLYEMIEEEFGTVYVQNKIDEVVQIKKDLREMRIKVSDTIKGDIPDYFQFKQRNFGKIRFSNQGQPVDDVYEGLKALYPGYFPADIYNPTDQLLRMVEVANLDSVYSEEYSLPEEQIQDVTDFISESVHEYKQEMAMKASHEANLAPIDESQIPYEEKPKRELPPSNFDSHDFTESRGVQQEYDLETEEIVDDTHDIELERLEKRKQKALDDLGDLTSYTKQQAQTLYDEVRMMQKGKKVSGDLGFILDRMFEGVDKKADNYEEVKDATYKKITDALLAIERSPAKPEREVPPAEKLIRNSIETKYGWRVSEIEGMKLDSRAEARRKLRKELIGMNAEGLTKALDDAKNVPMMLMNNTDTIRNTELVFGRENGKIINEAIFQKEIDNEAKSIAWQNKERSEIKELGIKARSKESAAVQKYGEKQYVNEFGDLVKYGDDELAAEGFDVETQAKIRKAARIIREKYDEYIDLANETLTKLGFDPIKKRNDYMRHFQELNDVFSRYGIPFNAQAMQEHDLPTDINGLTDSWSPQKNYFANMQPRKGERTTLDAVTGIDGYIGGIANLIYHTEDIQRGRAFEEIIRETYGEEKGWKNLEEMEGLSPEEYQARADKIQDNHLSNYAAWVHEWTNNIAGKKSKIDRSVESMFGRKAFALLDQVRKQVGSNMIGMNLSSSLTNLIAPVQAASKTKKLAVVKGTADTIKNIFVKDDFMEKNSFLTGRMGTDMLSKTAWQKVQDAGYIFMKGMDWFSSNQIVRSKYYELLSKGMTEEQAHAEAGKFAARIMGDRTKGAQAQLYNSKLIGLVTQFQLEVNNQLYSMFYDTYHESKEAAKNNAAKTAAGMTFTLGQLAALTHVFGQTFESIAGYNPTFDIIGIIATALGAGEDDDEKTTSERLKAAADKLVDALPYVNILTGGGRIPIASGIPNPIAVMTGGKDEYGNELTWKDEAKKLLYLIPPTGGNQVKKTYQGLSMFDEDLPVSGSYTDNGNLRFPVEDTPFNRAQAAIFGQWASGNAQKYFDQERQPLKEKQIQEYKDLDIPIAEYWEYREGLKDKEKIEDKFDYIAGLDLPVSKKNIMINNVVDRKDKVDLIDYDAFDSLEEFDFANKYPEKYEFFQSNGISYKKYAVSEESKLAYTWAYENPEAYRVSKVITGDFMEYREIRQTISKFKADKDANGDSISGTAKAKKVNYINGLSMDYNSKILLYKQLYPTDDTYNYEIIDYLNNRQDVSREDMVAILTALDFTVDAEGNIHW